MFNLSGPVMPCRGRLKTDLVCLWDIMKSHKNYYCTSIIEPICEVNDSTCREHCRSLMALRLPFQCSSWNTVISSWNTNTAKPAGIRDETCFRTLNTQQRLCYKSCMSPSESLFPVRCRVLASSSMLLVKDKQVTCGLKLMYITPLE